jgi:hypothetical protein
MPPQSNLTPAWFAFLTELDALLTEPIELQCLGGFVVAVQYGFPRPTADLDYIEIAPRGALAFLQELAGEGSALWKKHGLYLQHVTVANLPESYADRAVEIMPGQFKHLRFNGLEAHDLALSKLARNTQVDREDVQYLATTVPLDPAILKERYLNELRPIMIGDLHELDTTMELWLAAYFPN